MDAQPLSITVFERIIAAVHVSIFHSCGRILEKYRIFSDDVEPLPEHDSGCTDVALNMQSSRLEQWSRFMHVCRPARAGDRNAA